MPTEFEVRQRLKKINDDARQCQSTELSALNLSMGAKKIDLFPTDSDIQFGMNALSTTIGADSSFLVEPRTAEQIVEVGLAESSRMRQEGTVISGVVTNERFPTLEGGVEGVIISPDEPATSANLTVGSRLSPGIPYSSYLTPASRALVQDGGERFAKAILLGTARQVALRQNRAFTVGIGSNESQGITTGCAVGVTAALNNVITFDEIIDLTSSLTSEYLSAPVFMMNPTTYGYLRKQKDSAGNYKWVAAGLDKYRVALNSHMPDIGSRSKPIVFGDIRQCYTIRELQTTFQAITDHVGLSENGMIGYLAIQYADGFVSDSQAVKSLQMAT